MKKITIAYIAALRCNSKIANLMRILIVLNSLVQGGAQRFGVTLAEALRMNGHDVVLLTFYPEETDFFDVASTIPIIRLVNPFYDNGRIGKLASRNRMLLKVRRIWLRLIDLKTIRKLIKAQSPNVCVALERYVGVLMGMTIPGNIPLLVSERVHPGFHQVQWPFEQLAKIVFRRKNVFLHAQGESISAYMAEEFNKSVKVIPNFVSDEFNSLDSKPNTPHLYTKLVIAIGRYHQQKGFDLLIKSWFQIEPQDRGNWELHIFGDGLDSEFGKSLQNLLVDDTVRLFNATREIKEVLTRASIFVLSSRYEGFPNVLAEAMTLGKPCVSTDCPSAVRDLTLSGELALLVDCNTESLAQGIRSLIQDEAMREEFSSRAGKVRTLFSPKSVILEWENHLKAISK